MRKIRIFCADPDVTDSSSDEDDQNPKKEKKLIGEVLLPLKKKPSGRRRVVPADDEDDQNPKKEKKQPSRMFRGVRRQSWGSRRAENRNPSARRRETTTHKTEEEAAAAYLEKGEKYDAMKSQRSVPECTALSSTSSLSCKQKEEEAHNGVGVSAETDPEATDESILNALLDQKDEVPISDILADKHSPRDDYCKLNKPPEYDYIGLADISHLPLPFEDPLGDLNSDPDWSCLDLASIFSEPKDP